MDEPIITDESAAAEDRTILQRVLGIILTPRATFQALSRSIGLWDLLAPLLILLVISIGSQILVGPMLIEEQRQQIVQNRNITDEQRELFLERLDNSAANRSIQYLVGSVTVIAWYAILGGVIMFFGSFILGGKASYKETLAVVLYANLVGVIESAIKVPLMLQTESTRVATSLALLLPGGLGGTLIYRFFSRLDFFAIWKVILVALGVALVYKVDEKKARTVLLGAWAVVMFLLAWLLDANLAA